MCIKFINFLKAFWTLGLVLLPISFTYADKSNFSLTPKSQAERYHRQNLSKPVILVVSQDCAQCDHLLKSLKEKKGGCDKALVQKKLGLLAFGQKPKMQQKLWAFKNFEASYLEMSHSKQLSAEVTPLLWIKDDKAWDVKTGVNQIQNYLWDKENDLCRS